MIFEFAKQWASYGDANFASLIQSIGDISGVELQQKNAIWHKECYKDETTVNEIMNKLPVL